MKAATSRQIHFTPWHLRDRARSFRRDLAKTVHSNFFYSFLFLPGTKRDAIIDVYGFCRAIDDVVDDIADPARAGDDERAALAELAKWRREVEALYAGAPTQPIARKLQRVLEQFPMPKDYFLAMIDGCEMDLHKQRYETFEELYQYCYRVASITGLMCIEIFTYLSPRTREYAVDLGIALQLTNILRDLGEDARRGRIYLPREDLRRFGYGEEDLMNGVVNDSFRALMAFECDRARSYYDRAAEALAEEDRPTMTAALTMGRIYYRLLEQIERVDYDVFNHEIRLHRPERFLIAFGQWVRTAVAARKEGEDPGHEGEESDE
ncbi:MAG: presqualene diphosphate synthase HpnD [Blastocatellia bacterium]